MSVTGLGTFRVIETADFYHADGSPKYSSADPDKFAGHDHLRVTRFREHRPEITPDQWRGQNGAIVLTPRVTRDSIQDCPELLAIGRFGVGYDSVDVAACTDHDILVMIAAGAVDQSVAEATIGWMFALTHHVLAKDRLVRQGRWDDRNRYMGCELRERRLGVIGFGGIARALVRMLQGFGMQQPLAYDPFVSQETCSQYGVRSVGLDELLESADFVSVHCPLNDKTYRLIGAEQLRRMKPAAYLLNTARGGIVDENALYDALEQRRLAGAALDCFENEPLTEPSRFARFENVLLAPHSIAWTDELFRDIGRTICQSFIELSLGRRPLGVVNMELFERESFLRKWKRITSGAQTQM